MIFKDLRQAIIDKISLEIPDLQAVDPHPGQFNLNELKRITTLLPAVRVAVLNTQTISLVGNGEKDIPLQLAAYVITEDGTSPKDESAMEYVESLLELIPGQRWGISGVTDAKNIQAQNMFTTDADIYGVAMWSVTWEQSIRTGTDINLGGTTPSEVYLCGDSDNFGNEPAYDRVA